jgi:hypothetical protein
MKILLIFNTFLSFEKKRSDYHTIQAPFNLVMLLYQAAAV